MYFVEKQKKELCTDHRSSICEPCPKKKLEKGIAGMKASIEESEGSTNNCLTVCFDCEIIMMENLQ